MFLKRAIRLAGLALFCCFTEASCSSAVAGEESRAAGRVGSDARLKLVIYREDGLGPNTISFKLVEPRPEEGAGREDVIGRIRAVVGDGVLAIEDVYNGRRSPEICPKH